MKKILAIAPHADDEIIGLGGTLLKHVEQDDEVYVCIATKGVEPLFSKAFVEQLRGETINCHKILGVKKTFFLEFPSVMLESIPRHELNASMMNVFNEVKPNIVYIPHFGDMQKDHALVAESAMVCIRPKYDYKVTGVYAYETLSETEWNVPHVANAFIPQRYVDISETIDKKLQLMTCYKSQIAEFPNARSIEAIETLAKYRGATVGVKAAEAFAVVREIK
ncbi:MAG: PIG-L family deacetylase [Clostridiales bacterium]|nr:PIG-L family deacetylase [Clostridiales bacterium]